MCFNFSADQFQPTGFRLPKPKNRFSMLPTCRTTARMKGIDSPRWRLFSDVSFQRQTDGSELAGWRIAAVSADNFVRILCGPVTCEPGHPAFLGATSRSNNTAERSPVLLKPSDGLIPLFPVMNVFACCMTRNTPLVLLWIQSVNVVRCRLVAQEFAKGHVCEDLFAGTTPLLAAMMLVSELGRAKMDAYGDGFLVCICLRTSRGGCTSSSQQRILQASMESWSVS